MTLAVLHFAEPFHFGWLEQGVVVNGAIGRLLMACLLGGVVGLERELTKKSAGVRTNILICLGSAFFTLLSAVLAGDSAPIRAKSRRTSCKASAFSARG